MVSLSFAVSGASLLGIILLDLAPGALDSGTTYLFATVLLSLVSLLIGSVCGGRSTGGNGFRPALTADNNLGDGFASWL